MEAAQKPTHLPVVGDRSLVTTVTARRVLVLKVHAWPRLGVSGHVTQRKSLLLVGTDVTTTKGGSRGYVCGAPTRRSRFLGHMIHHALHTYSWLSET